MKIYKSIKKKVNMIYKTKLIREKFNTIKLNKTDDK